MKASMEASTTKASMKAYMEASNTKATTEAFMKALEAVEASMKASMEASTTSMKAMGRESLRSDGYFCGRHGIYHGSFHRFHGSFHELPPKPQTVQGVQPFRKPLLEVRSGGVDDWPKKQKNI